MHRTSKRNAGIHHQDMHRNVHGIFIYTSPRMKTIQTSVKGRRGEMWSVCAMEEHTGTKACLLLPLGCISEQHAEWKKLATTGPVYVVPFLGSSKTQQTLLCLKPAKLSSLCKEMPLCWFLTCPWILWHSSHQKLDCNHFLLEDAAETRPKLVIWPPAGHLEGLTLRSKPPCWEEAMWPRRSSMRR